MKILKTLYDEKKTLSYQREKISNVEDGNMVEIVGKIKISQREDKNKNPFYLLTIKDDTGVVTSFVSKKDKLYKAIETEEVSGNVMVRGDISENGTFKNLKPTYMAMVEYEASDSPYTSEVPSTPDLMVELETRIDGISNTFLKTIVNKAIESNKAAFITAPFSEKTAYAYKNGLVHFTIDMCDMTQNVSSSINCSFWGASTILNEDMMLTGAILGNIGKCKALTFDATGNIVKTPAGILEEDSVFSRDIVKDAIREAEKEMIKNKTPIPKEEVEKVSMELLHIISSLKGNTSWGALTSPRSKNAMILSNINNIVYTKGLFENLEKNNESNTFVKAYDSGKTYYIDEILE